MEPKEKKAFEPSGLVPRSIVRTFERFRQQLLPGSETAAIREYRISRYQVLVSARCLFTLLIIPIATNWLVSSWLLSPLVEHFWNTQQNEIFLNSYQEERAFAELESFSEKLFFESLLNTTNTINVESVASNPCKRASSLSKSSTTTSRLLAPLKCIHTPYPYTLIRLGQLQSIGPLPLGGIKMNSQISSFTPSGYALDQRFVSDFSKLVLVGSMRWEDYAINDLVSNSKSDRVNTLLAKASVPLSPSLLAQLNFYPSNPYPEGVQLVKEVQCCASSTCSEAYPPYPEGFNATLVQLRCQVRRFVVPIHLKQFILLDMPCLPQRVVQRWRYASSAKQITDLLPSGFNSTLLVQVAQNLGIPPGVHFSGFNSPAIARVNVDLSTPTPEGGEVKAQYLPLRNLVYDSYKYESYNNKSKICKKIFHFKYPEGVDICLSLDLPPATNSEGVKARIPLRTKFSFASKRSPLKYTPYPPAAHALYPPLKCTLAGYRACSTKLPSLRNEKSLQIKDLSPIFHFSEDVKQISDLLPSGFILVELKAGVYKAFTPSDGFAKAAGFSGGYKSDISFEQLGSSIFNLRYPKKIHFSGTNMQIHFSGEELTSVGSATICNSWENKTTDLSAPDPSILQTLFCFTPAGSGAKQIADLSLEKFNLVELAKTLDTEIKGESLLSVPLEGTYDNSSKIKEKVQNKILELAIYYNQQTIKSITNIVGDVVSLVTLGCLFIWMKPEITILKSFLIEAIYSLSDTTKSFLLILLTDLLVGFHSPRGWETALELLLKHFGLPENQDFVFLFVATFPVLLDTVFKYWIFRHLNKISPSTVATYHSMIE